MVEQPFLLQECVMLTLSERKDFSKLTDLLCLDAGHFCCSDAPWSPKECVCPRVVVATPESFPRTWTQVCLM